MDTNSIGMVMYIGINRSNPKRLSKAANTASRININLISIVKPPL